MGKLIGFLVFLAITPLLYEKRKLKSSVCFSFASIDLPGIIQDIPMIDQIAGLIMFVPNRHSS